MRTRTGPSLLTIYLLGTALLLGSCTKNLTHVNQVYSNDFEGSDLKGMLVTGWTTATTFGVFTYNKIYSYNGSKVLGRLNNGKIIVNISNLPAHSIMKVEYDLYLHDGWKNDLFIMQFDGALRLLTGFSNDSAVQQSYPNWFGNGSALSPAGNHAQEIALPSPCNNQRPRGTSWYKMVHTMPHTGNQFELSCSDAGGTPNDTCVRSWSIDNLKISTMRN
ncbi:MAG TPA: hypothetical protein VJ552_03755 [Sediminibacterium sp.]|nr:hypothetical protein [Sediminibacterium sp.]